MEEIRERVEDRERAQDLHRWESQAQATGDESWKHRKTTHGTAQNNNKRGEARTKRRFVSELTITLKLFREGDESEQSGRFGLNVIRRSRSRQIEITSMRLETN